MYIIEAQNDKRAWISGIFDNECMARTYLESIPSELKENQKLIQVQLSYPFHIVERDRHFKYVGKDEMIRELDQIDLVNDSDKVYFNIYTITSDYQPNLPGTDYMGILNHDHITNDFMTWYSNEGEEFLKKRRILPE
ncbi:hypothetical protein [Paenibacillus kobensis]|uniref:hypothetical protein n=1 Tax=Paenibacillus kobensis TaxID=59841 RepID=UPI000FD8051F|nr:hypothetical protein [Paenibacillus kobensis]